MSGISLTASMRSTLLSLQGTSKLMDLAQQRLSTGKKVNSAIDSPSNFYTAQSLNNRAKDLDALLDSMRQAVATIKAATEAVDSGLGSLEQAVSIAEQAITETANKTSDIAPKQIAKGISARPIEEFEAEGYKVIRSGMSATEIEELLASGKVVLAEDIVLDRGLIVSTSGVTIDGNGHKISYAASNTGESVIKVDGSGSSADIKNLQIDASGEQVYGISATNGGKVTLDNTNGRKVSGTNSQKIWYRDENLYTGKANTEAMLSEVAADALAATACNLFYVDDINGDFGQGNWYLPAIGELMEAYGYDTTKITSGTGISGAVGDNKTAINTALSTLADKGAEAAALTNG